MTVFDHGGQPPNPPSGDGVTGTTGTVFNHADLFEGIADRIPDRLALICGDDRVSYAELDARANRFAHALLDWGVKPHQHVGVQLYNGVEYMVAVLGALKIRAVPINVNYRYVEA